MSEPKPEYAPQPPRRPWYERDSAPLGKDEVDDYDRMMAPKRLQPKRKLFL